MGICDNGSFAVSNGGWSYIHVSRCSRTLPELMGQALAGLGYVTGLILDMCGNSGIGFDHVALIGRFVLEGKILKFQKRYQSAG